MLEHNVSPAEFEGAFYGPAASVRELEQRLERGWRMIEAEEAKGAPTDHLVNHLLNLLAQYESAYRELRAA
ncbi:MAG TPA: hypothetical protein VKZ96_05530 [Thermomicrobiales bacterium]|nr:hypothetical protein [Thermomicrobiales bacterium]